MFREKERPQDLVSHILTLFVPLHPRKHRQRRAAQTKGTMTTKRSIDDSQTNGNLGAHPGGVKSSSGKVGGGGDDEHLDKKFKQVHGDGDEDDDDDDEEEGPKSNKRTGRRKIKIEYIEDKSRRHITFSKRKSGIMKKVRYQDKSTPQKFAECLVHKSTRLMAMAL